MKCKKCGKEIPDGYEFCLECGYVMKKREGSVRSDLFAGLLLLLTAAGAMALVWYL